MPLRAMPDDSLPLAAPPARAAVPLAGMVAAFALACGAALLAPVLVETLRQPEPRNPEGLVLSVLLAFGLVPIALAGFLAGLWPVRAELAPLTTAQRVGRSALAGLGVAALLWAALTIRASLGRGSAQAIIALGAPSLAFLGARLLAGRRIELVPRERRTPPR